jgi:hypothetical protein
MTNRLGAWAVATALGAALAGCGGSTNPSGRAGGAVTGPVDAHCRTDGGVISQPTDPASCTYRPDGGVDEMPMYGDTLFNSEGDEDDCKYHLKLQVAPIYQKADVTFSLTATKRGDGTPLVGAKTSAEVFLSPTHPGPNTAWTSVESPPGTYTIGPYRFDASGRWTVRFHFFGDCLDFAEDSPHAHAAFYLDVP